MELVRQKNVATYITAPIIDADGDTVTGAAATGDSEIATWNDGAAPAGFADCFNEIVEIGATGVYYLSLTQAEMNNDYIYIQIKTAAAGAKTQHILIRTIIGDPLNIATTDDGGTINVTGGAIDTVTTLTGHTPQTGDSFPLVSTEIAEIYAAVITNAAGVDIAADIIAVKADTAAILLDTGTDGVILPQAQADKVWATAARVLTAGTNIVLAKGVGVTGFNDLSAAQVNTEVDTALVDVNLDHLVGTAVGIPAVPVGTYLDQIMDDGVATFDRATDSLQAIADSGGGGLTQQQVRDAMKLAPTVGAPAAGSVDIHLDDILTKLPDTISLANINAEVDTALSDINLDHFIGTAVGIPAVPAGTYLDLIMDDGVAVFDRATDSLQAIADGGGAALTAQEVRDAMKLAPTAGAPAAGSIDTHLDTIEARLPAALVGGRMDSSVGAMALGVVTAAAIATGAIDADALAADAVDEIWNEAMDASGSTARNILKSLFAIPEGKMIQDPDAGTFTFYEQDDVTPEFVQTYLGLTRTVA